MIKHASTHGIVNFDDGGADDMAISDGACDGNDVVCAVAIQGLHAV
jgi:hypothetical protein